MKRVNLEHAAATPVRPEVLEALLPFFPRAFLRTIRRYTTGPDI